MGTTSKKGGCVLWNGMGTNGEWGWMRAEFGWEGESIHIVCAGVGGIESGGVTMQCIISMGHASYCFSYLH